MADNRSLRGLRVIVAGGAGLVGARLVDRLAREGADVRASCHSRPAESHQPLYSRFDFTRAEDCRQAVHGAQAMVMAAAHVTGAGGDRDASLLPTLQIGAGLLTAAAASGVDRALLIGSATVYQAADRPLREEDLDRNRPPAPPDGGIGGVWRYLEELGRHLHETRRLRVGLLRVSNVFGPGDRFDGRAHVLPALIRRAEARETPFRVWGDGTTVRDFLYVDDLVDDLLDLLDRGCVGEPFNIADGNPRTVAEAAREVLAACGHPVEPEFDASRPAGAPFRALDISKLVARFGARPRTPFREALGETVAWYRDRVRRRGGAS